jgi:hypothetical protein
MATGTFSDKQTTFFISMLANLSGISVGTVDVIEVEFAKVIDDQLDKTRTKLGDWKVIWGPAVYQSNLTINAGNSMFVAQSLTEPSRLIVAIAGTNPFSAFDWIVEDIFVSVLVNWSYGDIPSDLTPQIANGTHLGLTIIQHLRPGPGFPGASNTLAEFLETLPPGDLDITIAGHSLGGALAPVTALWLNDTKSDWDPDGRATLFCLPSAGPTPGNQDFATYYSASPLGSRTTRIHNTLDIVPHAWADDDLEQIQDLYQPTIPRNPLSEAITVLGREISSGRAYAQIIPDAIPLVGVMHSREKPLSAITAPNDFIIEVTHQHVDAYFELLEVEGFEEFLKMLRDSARVAFGQGAIEAFMSRLNRRLTMTNFGNQIIKDAVDVIPNILGKIPHL